MCGGLLPAVHARVLHRGEPVYEGIFGRLALGENQALPGDALWRIYSMTKVFTVVAAMMLYEEGRFGMYDPLSRFFPEYKDVRVAHRGTNGLSQDMERVRAERALQNEWMEKL